MRADTHPVMKEVVVAGTRMSRWAFALLLAAACGGGDGANSDRTEHERDSIVGQSALPGAQGVEGALEAGDSAKARNARLDSLVAEP